MGSPRSGLPRIPKISYCLLVEHRCMKHYEPPFGAVFFGSRPQSAAVIAGKAYGQPPDSTEPERPTGALGLRAT